MSKETYDQLLKKIRTVSDIGGAIALLGWDQRTHMPANGAAVLFGLYWVVRLAVRHGATDASRRSPDASVLPGPPTT